MRQPLKAHFQLKLLTQLREKKSPLQQGFTLVELMIVVAVIGILSAVALPNFLQARNAASAGARVGEALGLAKECAVLAVSQIGNAPTGGPGVTVSCTSAGGTVVGSFAAGASGVRCLNNTSGPSSNKATVSISSTGSISCTFG